MSGIYCGFVGCHAGGSIPCPAAPGGHEATCMSAGEHRVCALLCEPHGAQPCPGTMACRPFTSGSLGVCMHPML